MTGQDAQRNGSLPAAQETLLWAVRLGLALTLAIPLVVTPGTIFPYVVGKALFARAIIEITFAGWLMLIICRREYRPAWSWVMLAAAVWLAVALIAGATGVSFTRSLWSTYERMQGVVDLAHWTAFILMAATLLRRHSDWRNFFRVNLAVCGVVAVLGLGQYYGLVNSAALAAEDRIASTLGNPTYLGAYMLLSALLGIGLLCHFAAAKGWMGEMPGRVDQGEGGRRWPWRGGWRYRGSWRELWPGLAAPVILLAAWTMWLSGTRGVLAGLLAGVGALALAYAIWGTGRWVRVGCGVLLAVLIILAALFVLTGDPAGSAARQAETNTMAARIASVGTADDSVRGRLIAIRAGIAAWRDAPLLGWGPENFLIAWGRYVEPHPPGLQQFDQAHSKVVEVMATVGTVGLLSYLALWAAMAWVMLRAFRRAAGADRLLIGVLGATMVSYFALHLSLFDTPGTVMLFAALAAFAVSEEWRMRAGVLADGKGSVGEPAARPAASGIAGRRHQLGQRWAQLPRSLRAAGATGLALLLAVMAAATALFSVVPIYAGAQSALPAANTALPWTIQAGQYRWGMQAFPGLANYLRIYFVGQATVLPEEFGGPELEQWSAVIGALGQEGLAVEPENWRLHTALARYYQAAVARDPQYLEAAQRHTAAALGLAPNVPAVAALQTGLERVQRQVAASYDVALDYDAKLLTYTKNPCGDEHIEPVFMLHIFPVDERDVPAAQLEQGFDNRDFGFSNHGLRRDGECVVQVELPDYDIGHIETGQYWFSSDDRIWQVSLYDEN